MRSVALFAVAVCACGRAPEAPLRFEVPWAEGEECGYDVLDARVAAITLGVALSRRDETPAAV
jgi:hypothetical protein